MRELTVAILVDRDEPDPAPLVRGLRGIGARSVRVVRDAREFVSAGCPATVLVALCPSWAIYDAMCHGLIVATCQQNRFLWHMNNSVRVPSRGMIPAALKRLVDNEYLAQIIRGQAERIRLRCGRKEFSESFATQPPPPPAAPADCRQPAQERPEPERSQPVPIQNPLPEESKVSVVMPCYNDENVIGDSARSVLAQAWQNLELVIVDDGSTDGTRNEIAKIADSDDRVTVSYKPNGGPSSARNFGLNLVDPESEYIAFLDSDDAWDREFLSKLIRALRAAPPSVAFAYCNSEVSLDGEFKEVAGVEYSWPKLINGWGIIPTGTFVLTREAIEVAGPFDEEIERGEDLEWMWRVGLHWDFVHVDETLHRYQRESGGQLATSPVNIELLERRRRECLSLRGPSDAPVSPERRPGGTRSSIASGRKRGPQ